MTPFDSLLLSLALTTIPLGVGLLAARRLRPRAALSSLLLRATLIATIVVFVAPMLPLPRPRPSWLPSLSVVAPRLRSHQPAPASPSTSTAENLPGAETAVPQSKYFDSGALPKSAKETAAPSITLAPSELAPEVVAPIVPASTTPKYFDVDWRTGLGLFWVAGALTMLLTLAWCHLRVSFLRRGGTSMHDGESFEPVRDIAAAWSMPAPRLWSSAHIDTPFACGVWRASICLPSWWPQGIDAGQQRAILRHEIAHVRRADCTWNALALTMRAVLWPQPLGWLLCRELVRNSEDVCDEAALEGEAAPHQYARCLLDLSQRLQGRRNFERTIRTAAAGARPTPSELGRRVRRILNNPLRDAWRLPLRARIGAGIGIAFVAAAALLMTGEAATGESPSPKTPASTRRAIKVLSGPVAVNLSSPRATLDSFVRALNAGDATALVRCVRTSNSPADVADFAASLPSRMNFRVSPWSISTTNNAAIARAQVTSDPDRGTPVGRSGWQGKTTLRLMKSPSGWKIFADNWLSGRNDALTWVVATVANSDLARLRTWALNHNRAVLTGKVLLPDGKPAEGALVRLQMTQTSRERIPGFDRNNVPMPHPYAIPQPMQQILSREVTTASDGTYRIEGLADALYAVVATWPQVERKVNRAKSLWAWQTPEADSSHVAPMQTISTRSNAVSDAPDLKLQATAHLEVRVVDNQTQAPLNEVFVSVGSHPERRTRLNEAYKLTGDDGRAVFQVLPGQVGVTLGGETSPGGHGMITRTKRGVYAIGRDQLIAIDGNAPVKTPYGVRVQCTPERPRVVTIRLPKYKPASSNSARAAKIKLPPPRLTIPRGGKGSGVLSGKVLYGDGRPAAGVRVSARMQRSAQWDVFRSVGLDYGQFDREPYRSRWSRVQKLLATSDTTDAEGNFRLTGLMTAPYDLMTGDSSYGWPNPGTINGTLSSAVIGAWARDGQTVRRTAPIVLTRGALIRGRVVDRKSGAGVGGVIVACYGPHRPRSSDSVASIKTNPDGSFQMRVAPGRNQLYIAGPANNRLSGHTRFADDAAENANRSIRRGVYVINAARGLYDGSRSRYRLDQNAAWYETKDMEHIEVEAQNHQTHDLEIQLRRLRPATPAEEEM